MRRVGKLVATACILAGAVSAKVDASQADSWKMEGIKQITLHTRDGETIPIGTVDFHPQGDKTSFKIHLDPKKFTVFFLSMRNFDCLEGPEVTCAVPYPYDNPATATPQNLDWLADNLLFLFKTKQEHAATMSNGIRFDLKLSDRGIAGKPQAIDLNDIAPLPKDPTVAPYGPTDRDDYPEHSRWVDEPRIE